jgi:eukaryotic-like serine/threonine-protein kinase
MLERDIFHAALAIADPAKRSAYLAEVFAGKPELRQHVEGLLDMHGQLGSFLEAPAISVAATADVTPAEHPCTLIGPYKLHEQIGEGGFGVVFMAEQQEPIRRKVAVKVVKPGMDSRQVIARFEAERQALALMDHPNIAKVLDAGQTLSGRPYFVMELVKGLPITDFCDQSRFTAKERLGLFVDVCRAVQHAHQKAIIHRDIKPSNVLVTLQDGTPLVQVIDFGISKALGQQLTDKTLLTGFAQTLGTPVYMSPEQMALSKTDVDTCSDIYSLGVLLYELLTGTTPFEKERLHQASYDEMRRIIGEEEPPKPSTRLSTLEKGALSTVCEHRRADPRKLSEQVRGELDWIVMKALEKDRNRRYESASALAADVQRYLNDEPVQACPPSTGYRLRKFARRNRRSLVTAGVIAVALVAATVVSAWQATVAWDAQFQAEADRNQAEADRKQAVTDRKQAEADRKQAETDRDRAKSAEQQAKKEQDRAKTAERRAATEADIARAVSNFLRKDVLDQARSDTEIGEDIGKSSSLTVREALDRAAARIGERFRDQPLVEAAIRSTIGSAYQNLYENQRAVPHLERAVTLRKAHLGSDRPETIDSMDVLARVYWELSPNDKAIALHQEILESMQARLGPEHPETFPWIYNLAASCRYAGELETSARLLKELLEKQRAFHGSLHPGTWNTMRELGLTYGIMDRFPESIALLEEALELRKKRFGPLNRDTYEMHTLVEVFLWAGKFEQAECLVHELIPLYRKPKDSLGARNALANGLGQLARSLFFQKKYDAAEPVAREAVALNQPEGYKRSLNTSVLGAVLLAQKNYSEAEPLLLQGCQGMKELVAHSPVRLRQLRLAVEWIVRLYDETNQPDKARAWREKLAASKTSVETGAKR